jgi:hypothetical protein
MNTISYMLYVLLLARGIVLISFGDRKIQKHMIYEFKFVIRQNAPINPLSFTYVLSDDILMSQSIKDSRK